MQINNFLSFKHKEIVLHILFWILYFIYPIIKFGDRESFGYDFSDNLIAMLFLSISIYTTYFLFNKFFKNKLYFFIALGVLKLSVLLNCLTLIYIDDCHCDLQICYINKFVEYIFVNIFFITILIFKKNVLNQQALQKSEQERINAELNGLKAQVNPHFLFNTLNMLYANAIAKDKGLPDRILQLSDNLHYMLHEGNKNNVNINQELKFIKDYINLQNARTGKKNDVKFISSIDNFNQQIPPLLLIPFIENAFKYSNMTKGKQLPILINIKLLNKTLLLTVENVFDPIYKKKQDDIWKSSGIGIKNTERRLAILFPEKHKLSISTENNIYKINLEIKLG